MATDEAEAPVVDPEVEAQAEAEPENKHDAEHRQARTVPLPELLAERKKRQEREAELERTRGELEAYRRQQQAQPAKPKEPDDSEFWSEGPAKYANRTARTVAQEVALSVKMDISRDNAIDKWSDYQEKETYWRQNASFKDRDEMLAHPNPAKFAYQWAKSRMEPQLSAEEQEAKVREKVLAELREKGIEIPDEGETKRKPVPRTMARERGGGRDAVQVNNLTAIEMARQAQRLKNGGVRF